jgi:hypothetical protein
VLGPRGSGVGGRAGEGRKQSRGGWVGGGFEGRLDGGGAGPTACGHPRGRAMRVVGPKPFASSFAEGRAVCMWVYLQGAVQRLYVLGRYQQVWLQAETLHGMMMVPPDPVCLAAACCAPPPVCCVG